MSQQFTSSMHSAMEQAKYWMWTRRKFPVRPSFFDSPIPSTIPPTAYYGESWEEKAFAEDSAGLLGGCVWPPRSYSCSFCGREFRSAQALGGHMNVHRRDRARLKQSSLAPDDVDHEDRHRIDSSTIPNPNPNFGIDASLPPSRKVIDDLNFSATHSLWGVELKLGSKRRMEVEEEDDDDDDKIQHSCKRKKIDSFLFVEGKLNLSPGAVEDLDLELRLGDLPKVK